MRFGAWFSVYLTCLGCLASGCGGTQTDLAPSPAADAAPELVPVTPLLLNYNLWDHHFIQWLGEDSEYEAIELLVKERVEQTSLWLFLTERASDAGDRHRIHFVNDPIIQDEIVEAPGDREVYLAEIEYERTEKKQGSQLRVKLTPPLGEIVWEFQAEGAPSDEHGPELSGALEAAHDLGDGLLVFYVERSAVSAASSRVLLAGRELRAQPWPELGQSRELSAYRGVYSRPAHVGYFPALASSSIHRVSGPEIETGDVRWAYERTTPGRLVRSLLITLAVRGDSWMFAGPSLTQVTRRGPRGFSTSSLVARDIEQFLTLAFEPPLPDLRSMAGGSFSSSWVLHLAGADRLQGKIELNKRGRSIELRLRPEPPGRAHEPFVANIELTEGGYQYESRTERSQR